MHTQKTAGSIAIVLRVEILWELLAGSGFLETSEMKL
jgi:hypothetical protein